MCPNIILCDQASAIAETERKKKTMYAGDHLFRERIVLSWKDVLTPFKIRVSRGYVNFTDLVYHVINLIL